MPAPPASESSANTKRTRVASTRSVDASPPHTRPRSRGRRARCVRTAAPGSDSSCAHHVDATCTDLCVDHERALPDVHDRVPPVVVPLEAEDLADLGVCVHGYCRVAGDDDLELADSDGRLDVRILRDWADLRQVDA